MPRTFRDSLEDDLEAVFFNTDEFAELVSIGRRLRTTANVSAIVAARSYQVTKDGKELAFQCIDFDIIKSKYIIGGEQVDPQEGDKITKSTGEVCEVLPKDVLGRCFEAAGSDGLIVRVHTKRVA